MKKLLYIFAFILSSNVFAFERIGNIVEKDNLFHYENYDRVQYHKLREKEYQILTKRLNSLNMNNSSEFIVENIAKVEPKEASSPEVVKKIEQTEDKDPKDKNKSLDIGADPLMIQESDIINIAY